jgi:AraC-like DNA-binding protein
MKAGMLSGKQRAAEIVRVLRLAGQAMGLKLCLHDCLRRVQEVPQPWRHHRAAICRRSKARDEQRCRAFDGDEVHRALSGLPEGRIHECPLGVTELAVPVMDGGLLVGVLFAGPCWCRRTPPPAPGMVVLPDRQWLASRLLLLRGVARLLSDQMRLEGDYLPGDRRLKITQYLQAHIDRPIRLNDLARHISLSPSRTRHAIREIFSLSFLELVRSIKLQMGAHLLRMTDLPVGEIAARVGYQDQSYFARLFARRLAVTPRAFRREQRS